MTLGDSRLRGNNVVGLRCLILSSRSYNDDITWVQNGELHMSGLTSSDFRRLPSFVLLRPFCFFHEVCIYKLQK